MKDKIGKQLIWQGFNIRWENYPHRLSLLGSRFNNLRYKKKAISAYHDLHVKIGNFPKDAMLYSVLYSSVEAEGVYMGQGRTPVFYTKSKRGKEADEQFTVQFKLKDLDASFKSSKLNSDNCDVLTVLLNGFHVEAANNVSGWHFGGLGIQLKNLRWLGEDELAFDLNLHTRPASAPEPFEHGNVDARGKKWSNSDPCIYAFEIDFCVVLGNQEKLLVLEDSAKHSVERKYQSHCDEDLVFDYDKKRFSGAFTGLQGFKVCLKAQNPKAKKTGRYFRELGVFVSDVATKKGRLTCKSNIKFSNQSYPSGSLSANPWRMDAELNVACICSEGKLGVGYQIFSSRTGKSSQQHAISNRIVEDFDLL